MTAVQRKNWLKLQRRLRRAQERARLRFSSHRARRSTSTSRLPHGAEPAPPRGEACLALL